MRPPAPTLSSPRSPWLLAASVTLHLLALGMMVGGATGARPTDGGRPGDPAVAFGLELLAQAGEASEGEAAEPVLPPTAAEPPAPPPAAAAEPVPGPMPEPDAPPAATSTALALPPPQTRPETPPEAAVIVPPSRRKPPVPPRPSLAARQPHHPESPAPAPPLLKAASAQPTPGLPGDAAGGSDHRGSSSGGTAENDEAAAAVLTSYLQSLRQRLERARRYPAEARAWGWSGTATVRFVIARDGQAQRLALVRSSGQELLDSAALATVEHAAPFPALPPELARDRLDLTLPIAFRLERP